MRLNIRAIHIYKFEVCLYMHTLIIIFYLYDNNLLQLLISEFPKFSLSYGDIYLLDANICLAFHVLFDK